MRPLASLLLRQPGLRLSRQYQRIFLVMAALAVALCYPELLPATVSLVVWWPVEQWLSA